MVGEVAPGFGTLACRQARTGYRGRACGPRGRAAHAADQRDRALRAARHHRAAQGSSPRDLIVSVSHETKGCWNLAITADGKRAQAIRASAATNAEAGWQTLSLDLGALAGRTVTLELANALGRQRAGRRLLGRSGDSCSIDDGQRQIVAEGLGRPDRVAGIVRPKPRSDREWPTIRFPRCESPTKVKKNQVLLVASGDLRLSANQKCWPAQQEMEQALDPRRRRRRLRAGAGPSLQTRPSSTASSPRKRKAWRSSARSIPRRR